MNADSIDTLSVKKDFHDKNLYGYCDNNPVVRVDVEGEIWVAAIAVGVGTQYVGDILNELFEKRQNILNNIEKGKRGIDILRPCSSIGSYVSAGITALIPGSGVGAVIVRNVVGEVANQGTNYVVTTVKTRTVKKPKINWKNTVGKVAFSCFYDGASDKVTSGIMKKIYKKRPQNYKAFAKREYKKHPNIRRRGIMKYRRSKRRKKRVSNVLSFIAGVIGAKM